MRGKGTEMFGYSADVKQPNLDDLRKQAQILIIDDQEWPHQRQLEADHYHVKRWVDIEDTNSLTDGSFALVLLDVNGVGLKHSPERHGIGILDHIKKTNTSQLVIVYSAHPQAVQDAVTLARADAVMDKGNSYLDFREAIDRLLLRRATPDYFIASMNQALGANAAKAPKAVPLAMKALRTGNTSRLHAYLARTISNDIAEEVVAYVIRVGIKVLTGTD